jgi:hypothetical protein
MNGDEIRSDGGPGSGRYPKGSGNIYSASGANPSIPDMTPVSLDKHWGGSSDHSYQYPELDKAGYAKRAAELVRSPIGGDIDGYKSRDGAIVRYDKATNDFAKGYDTGVASMYKPNDGAEYFKRAMKREGGTQDD